MIGVPLINDSTGRTQMNSTVDLLDEWKVKDEVIGMSFDTTSSNSGIRNGCCSLMEIKLARALLWCACRHHTSELHVKHAWQAIRGDRVVGPEEQLFKKFQADWETIDRDTNDLNLFEWPEKSTELFNQAENVLNWAKVCIEKKTFPREDYRELIELIFVYLGGQLPVRKFFLRRPGAMHHARFMSKSLYLLKMELLSERINFSVEERRQINKMARFIALFFAKYFLRSRIAVFSPLDDLKFIGSMISYREEEPDISSAVLTSIKRHLWYLTEELVVLSIFNEDLSSFTRSMMAQKLFSIPRPTHFEPRKPKFPTIIQNDLPFLPHLLGPRSWLLFSFFPGMHDWLQIPPQYWNLITEYRIIRDFCLKLEVVNDAAERGIKIVEDFSHITENEEQFQFLLQCVEDHRKSLSSFNQSVLSKNL